MRLYIAFYLIVTGGLFAQEHVNKLRIDNTTPQSAPATQQNPDSPASEMQQDIQQLVKEGPFNILTNPKFQQAIKTFSSKKMIGVLNQMADKNKMKTMAIGQILLVITVMVIRSLIVSKNMGFFAILAGNTLTMALHVFIALLVLPRFIYGPDYFYFLTEFKKLMS